MRTQILYMKNKLLILSTGFALFGAFTFVSCSQEEDYMFDSNLSINSQVPKTRSGADQYFETEGANMAYEKLENGCGLTMMVEAWIASRPKGYFNDVNFTYNGKTTAQEYQDKLIREMLKDPSYGWTLDSKTMSISTLMMLSERFPNGQKKVNGVYVPNTLFSGYDRFSSENDTNNFFKNNDNRERVNGILLEDKNGNSHMAFVKNCSQNTLEFTGYSIMDSSGSYDGGCMRPNGSYQNGWKIVGVTYK